MDERHRNRAGPDPPRCAHAGGAGTAEADHLVRADVGLWLRHGFLRRRRSRALGAVDAGVLLAGPLVCGTSQAANDWFDRDVDAINEPDRPIPSGRLPGRTGPYIAMAWTRCRCWSRPLWAAGVWRGRGRPGARLGLQRAAAAAEAERLVGQRRLAACYEGLPWITGAAVMAADRPDWRILSMAALYSVGAHGIMTLNDFKSVEGDRRTGIGSLPVRLGVARAARLRLRGDGGAAGGCHRVAARAGACRCTPARWRCCWRRSLC